MRVFIVPWLIRHNHMQKRWLCVRLCHTQIILHIQGGNQGNIIKFAQFEQGYLLSETHNLLSETHHLLSENCHDAESGNKYDDNSTMPPLISK